MTKHPTDRWSLWLGILFLVFVAWWLLGSQIKVDMATVGLILAGGLILFGVLGLIGSLRPRQRTEPVSTPPLDLD